MQTRFAHVNIVSKNWKALAEFYIKVFNCRPVLPERDLSGDWLDRLTGLDQSGIKGLHLQLPGYNANGPTLEIFEYNRELNNSNKQINRNGLAHIAFAVKDVEEKLQHLLDNGGSIVGEVVNTDIKGAGKICVVYARDPEGNIIELQKWG